ncbi:MAG: reverse transcriptase family protein [Steroidobacteraceae bacterium]
MTDLVSIRELSRRLGVPRERLENVAAHINEHYRSWQRSDFKTGKTRTISSPSKILKNIQKQILRRLLNTVAFGDEVQGGVRGRSPHTNAIKHLRQPCVIAVDVRQFFPNVRHTIVYRLLRTEFGFGRNVAALVTRLITHRGCLPQGACTSAVVANALLRLPVDGPVLAGARNIGCAYTRFVDDLTTSGRNPRELINLIARQLSTRALAISRKEKLRIMSNSEPQEITGLLVNGKRPSLSKARRDRVRAAIHALHKMPQSSQCAKSIQSAKGRIAYVRQFNPGSAKRLERQFKGAVAS